MKKIMILGLLIIIFMMGCVNDYDDKLPPLLDENGSIIDEGPFARMNTCEGLCEEKGLVFSSCGESSISDPDALFCNEGDIDVGMSDYCVDENGERDYKTCCCKETHKFETMKVIDVQMNVAPSGSQGAYYASIATIFVTSEGEILPSYVTFAEPFTYKINKALEAAKSTDLELLGETLEIIDGEEALVMRGFAVAPTNPYYIFALKDFLDNYDFEYTDFRFVLADAEEWSAYKEVVTDNCEGDYEHCSPLSEDVMVLTFENIKDGFLISAGPGIVEPAIHPFINARFKSEEEEPAIADIIDESESFTGFLANLVEAGYFVVHGDTGNYMLSG